MAYPVDETVSGFFSDFASPQTPPPPDFDWDDGFTSQQAEDRRALSENPEVLRRARAL